jgi:phosphohistidine swiveling domain-containing protein
MKKEIIIFDKTVERDSTLVMQGIWARVLTGNIEKKFGIKSSHRPAIIHYATEENLQVWENRKAVEELQNELLENNLNGVDFMESVFSEYKEHVSRLNKFWDKGYVAEKGELEEYLELIEKAVLGCTIFFYAGNDERTSEEVKGITIKGREIADLFSRSDEFIRNCVRHIDVKYNQNTTPPPLRGTSPLLDGVESASPQLRGGGSSGAIQKENRESLNGLEDLVLPDELLNLPDKRELQKRAKGTILIDGIDVAFSTLEEFSKNHIEEYKFESFAAVNDIIELRGQAAYLGRASGTVKIVKNRRQIENVGEGDILVSPMTTPDFLAAMKKAAAFVTDEGGIVCHAAIVAREMKKPCIVGTKIATQVLKDGDLVEVDAEKGVVRILKS